MIELVFVIVILGILVAVALPRMQSNCNSYTAMELESSLRYAQHLALVDDKFGTTLKWRFDYNSTNFSYSITDGAIFAKNAQTHEPMQDLKLKSTLTFSGACAAATFISFDYMGRPYTNAGLLTAPCMLTLTCAGEPDETITIYQETGYAKRNL